VVPAAGHPDGSVEREFWFTVKNVGATQCSTDVQLAPIMA
jgi:hypothetical protein